MLDRLRASAKRKITSATAKIEHPCIPPLHDWPQAPRSATRHTRSSCRDSK